MTKIGAIATCLIAVAAMCGTGFAVESTQQPSLPTNAVGNGLSLPANQVAPAAPQVQTVPAQAAVPLPAQLANTLASAPAIQAQPAASAVMPQNLPKIPDAARQTVKQPALRAQAQPDQPTESIPLAKPAPDAQVMPKAAEPPSSMGSSFTAMPKVDTDLTVPSKQAVPQIPSIQKPAVAGAGDVPLTLQAEPKSEEKPGPVATAVPAQPKAAALPEVKSAIPGKADARGLKLETVCNCPKPEPCPACPQVEPCPSPAPPMDNPAQAQIKAPESAPSLPKASVKPAEPALKPAVEAKPNSVPAAKSQPPEAKPVAQAAKPSNPVASLAPNATVAAAAKSAPTATIKIGLTPAAPVVKPSAAQQPKGAPVAAGSTTSGPTPIQKLTKPASIQQPAQAAPAVKVPAAATSGKPAGNTQLAPPAAKETASNKSEASQGPTAAPSGSDQAQAGSEPDQAPTQEKQQVVTAAPEQKPAPASAPASLKQTNILWKKIPAAAGTVSAPQKVTK